MSYIGNALGRYGWVRAIRRVAVPHNQGVMCSQEAARLREHSVCHSNEEDFRPGGASTNLALWNSLRGQLLGEADVVAFYDPIQPLPIDAKKS